MPDRTAPRPERPPGKHPWPDRGIVRYGAAWRGDATTRQRRDDHDPGAEALRAKHPRNEPAHRVADDDRPPAEAGHRHAHRIDIVGEALPPEDHHVARRVAGKGRHDAVVTGVGEEGPPRLEMRRLAAGAMDEDDGRLVGHRRESKVFSYQVEVVRLRLSHTPCRPVRGAARSGAPQTRDPETLKRGSLTCSGSCGWR